MPEEKFYEMKQGRACSYRGVLVRIGFLVTENESRKIEETNCFKVFTSLNAVNMLSI
jgi:hypothetical protein